jgi:rhodanese-related sulfurtransferase
MRTATIIPDAAVIAATTRTAARRPQRSATMPASRSPPGHIPGAVSIPLEEPAERLAELPMDQEIVAYCRGAYCVFAHDAVRLLTARGRQARRLADGMLEWRLAGLPVAL